MSCQIKERIITPFHTLNPRTADGTKNKPYYMKLFNIQITTQGKGTQVKHTNLTREQAISYIDSYHAEDVARNGEYDMSEPSWANYPTGDIYSYYADNRTFEAIEIKAESTKVEFYIEKDGDGVYAYFPEIAHNKDNNTSYAHIGQHSACSPDYVKECTPASPAQYADLKAELESIGYVLDIAPVATLIKTIDVTALEWFDRVNGNSYFAATVIINYGMDNARTIYLPFQYGYGEQYTQEAFSELKKQGILSEYAQRFHTISQYCRENGIILRTAKHEGCKKAELKAIGK